jgi:hypothetical protein
MRGHQASVSCGIFGVRHASPRVRLRGNVVTALWMELLC